LRHIPFGVDTNEVAELELDDVDDVDADEVVGADEEDDGDEDELEVGEALEVEVAALVVSEITLPSPDTVADRDSGYQHPGSVVACVGCVLAHMPP